MKIIELMGPTGVGKSYLSRKLSNFKKRDWFVEPQHENLYNRLILRHLSFKSNDQLNIKTINSSFLKACRESLNQYKDSDIQYFHSINKLQLSLKKNSKYKSIVYKKNKIILDQGISQKIFFVNPHYIQQYEYHVSSYFKKMPPINGVIIIKESEELIFDRIKKRKSRTNTFPSELSGLKENEIINVLKKYNHWCNIAHNELLLRGIPVFIFNSELNTVEDLAEYINNI